MAQSKKAAAQSIVPLEKRQPAYITEWQKFKAIVDGVEIESMKLSEIASVFQPLADQSNAFSRALKEANREADQEVQLTKELLS